MPEAAPEGRSVARHGYAMGSSSRPVQAAVSASSVRLQESAGTRQDLPRCEVRFRRHDHTVLLERVAVHLVAEGADADSQQSGGALAVLIALGQRGEDRGLLRLLDRRVEVQSARAGLALRISLGRSSAWITGPSTVATSRSMQFRNCRTLPGQE